MASPILMPQASNSATSYLLAAWKKKVGETVKKGEVLCEVETDKAIVEVESERDGVLLAQLYKAGDDVPVLVPIAYVGEAGEKPPSPLTPLPQAARVEKPPSPPSPLPQAARVEKMPDPAPSAPSSPYHPEGKGLGIRAENTPISPRAKLLVQAVGLDLAQVAISATGPEGRIIERDIRQALAQHPKLTRAAQTSAQGVRLPAQGTGIGGRITQADIQAQLVQAQAQLAQAQSAQVGQAPVQSSVADELEIVPLRGTRKVIAERMLASLQNTAQLTLNAWAEARALLDYRARLKNSAEGLGLREVTINDLVLYATARALLGFPYMNTHLKDHALHHYKRVHLGFAVDTPRGLLVPVLHDAHHMSLKHLSQTAKRLAESAISGKIAPADLEGGTFTVTNLGSLGVEHFTPVLNPPQVGILGVGGIVLRPVGDLDGKNVQHVPHIALSLTVDHQAVDGAPAARFLQGLSKLLSQVDVLTAL